MKTVGHKPIPLEVARKLFAVDNGRLVYRAAHFNVGRKVGDEVGNVHKRSGYRVTEIAGYGKFRVHRIIYAMTHGVEIFGELDHRNRNKLDNTPENLREVSRSENMLNTGIFSNNTSGVKGVNYSKRLRKFIAYIKVHGKHIHLGVFSCIEDAKAKRLAAEQGIGI